MTFSCESAMAELGAEYLGLDLTTRAGKPVTLRNLLMLGTDGLRTAQDALTAFSEDADAMTQLDRLRDLVLLLADDRKAMEREVADWPLGMYMRAIDAWREVTEVGEARDSES